MYVSYNGLTDTLTFGAIVHHDNRDFDILPNFQPHSIPSFNEQTLLLGKSTGVRYISFASQTIGLLIFLLLAGLVICFPESIYQCPAASKRSGWLCRRETPRWWPTEAESRSRNSTAVEGTFVKTDRRGTQGGTVTRCTCAHRFWTRCVIADSRWGVIHQLCHYTDKLVGALPQPHATSSSRCASWGN